MEIHSASGGLPLQVLIKETGLAGSVPPENIRGLKAVQSSDLWALGCIIFEIRSGRFLFPTAIESLPSDTLWEIEHALGSLPSDLPSLKHDGDAYSESSARSKVSVESARRIYQRVSEIKVEPIANSEVGMTESEVQQEARNRYAQIRPYIKSDPTLFWKPEPAMTSSSVDRLIRTWDEILTEREMWKEEKPSPKISSTEAEQLASLLSGVLSYFPKERQAAARLAKHPCFVEPVKSESHTAENRKRVSPVESRVCWMYTIISTRLHRQRQRTCLSASMKNNGWVLITYLASISHIPGFLCMIFYVVTFWHQICYPLKWNLSSIGNHSPFDEMIAVSLLIIFIAFICRCNSFPIICCSNCAVSFFL